MEEIWKDVVGFDGFYEVSNTGRVRSVDRIIKSSKRSHFKLKGKIVGNKNNAGYMVVTISKELLSEERLIHRIVAEAFIPNPNNLPQVNHINGDKKDNRVENLEWVSNRENTCHARVGKFTSKHSNVCWLPDRKKWKSYIQINNKRIQLGRFDTEEEAFAAVQKVRSDFGISNRYKSIDQPA